MKRQIGFTLIELVMVIVILGILAATALPKFVDLSGEADQAAVNGVAAAISSATSINYALKKINSASGVAIAHATDSCATVASSSVLAGAGNLLQSGITLQTTAPTTNTQFQIAALSGACAGGGGTATCTITSKGGKTATANATCTN